MTAEYESLGLTNDYSLILFYTFGSRHHEIFFVIVTKCFSPLNETSLAFKYNLSQSMQTTGNKQFQQDNCIQAACVDSVVLDFRAQ